MINFSAAVTADVSPPLAEDSAACMVSYPFRRNYLSNYPLVFFRFVCNLAVMTVRRKIVECNGVFFITFTCAHWLPLFTITGAYDAVYKWFDFLKKNGHYIVSYVIMPSHVHAVIAFSTSKASINTLVANGKRFIAYELVKRLMLNGSDELLRQMASWVNKNDQRHNKLHEVFEPSFDRKECYSMKFLIQKVNYIHLNPCKSRLTKMPEDYPHSSARYYFTGVQGLYPVITYMELEDIDLGM